MKIPVANIYYLLLYAWNALREAEVCSVGAAESTTLLDLFARVLKNGVDHVLRRGLDRGYVQEDEELLGVRGRIDLAQSIKRGALGRGALVCSFDDLSHDVIHNRLVRQTLLRLTQHDAVDPGLRRELAATYRRLEGIQPVRLRPSAFRKVQLHSNNSFYRFLLSVCRFVVDGLMPFEGRDEAWLRDFLRDDRMAVLFESFARNFYAVEQKRYSVKSERLPWQHTTGVSESLSLLPYLITDISLSCSDRRIVIDTKWYQQALAQGPYKKTVRSEHLFQLFAYVRNLTAKHGRSPTVEGMLLYPTVAKELDLRYVIHGHPMRVATVDLSLDWPSIRTRLLDLVAA